MVTLPVWYVVVVTFLAVIGAGTVGIFVDRIMGGKLLPRDWRRPRVVAKD